MKNYLAADTASKYLCVVLCYRGKKYEIFKDDCAMRHSSELMPAADKLFKEAGAEPSEMDFFACSVGAGSFTGIRIGIAAMKGFALATGKKILPVTTFDCAAYNGEGKKILCLCDALHAHYYACGYDESGKRTFPPAYISEAELRALAAQGYELRTLENPDFLPADLPCVRVTPAIALAGAAEKLSENPENFKEPAALYIRKCQAEIEKDAKASASAGGAAADKTSADTKAAGGAAE